jgi:translation initiation factor IF-1
MREQEATSASNTLNGSNPSTANQPRDIIFNTPHPVISADEELARQLATERDASVALDWQYDERAELIHSHPRNFDAVESSYVNLKQEQEDGCDDDYSSDEYTEYNIKPKDTKYTAPKNVRTGENQTEFKTYSTRNTGAKEFKKKQKFIAKQYKAAVTVFQIKQEDSDYGRIRGKNLKHVFCFWDGLTRKAHVLKKVKMNRGISDGSLVLVKVRQYQDNVVDVFHVYSPLEEATLFEMGEIVTQDPIEYLPLEVIRLVLEHMQSQHAMDMLRQVSRNWNVVAKEHSPAKYLPLKLQYQRRIKEIEWEDLSKWRCELDNHKVKFDLVSSNQCKFFWGSGLYHFQHNCDLEKRVLHIAEMVWNEFAPVHQRTPPRQSDDDTKLFTYTKCLYLHRFKDSQLRNFATLVLWSWIKFHERRDLDKIDVPECYRALLIQSARSCVENLISNLKNSLNTSSSQRSSIQTRISFLEERWKLLLEQPKLYLEKIDFTVESDVESDDIDSEGELPDDQDSDESNSAPASDDDWNLSSAED